MTIRGLIDILPEPLRQRSLTHPSVADAYDSNGRLEFLGDSVLNSRVAELVFHGYPELLEGDLTRIRTHLVRKSFLATVGRGAGRAMRPALGDGGLEPGDVGHVNAHATSTPTGDGPETKAIKRLLPHAAVSGTKSMTGHSFGAVGATEGIMCALAIKHKVLPPTINLEDLAEDCEKLDYVKGEAREALNLKATISNSMGFGGHNVVVAFSGVE